MSEHQSSPDENEIDASGAPHSWIPRYSPGSDVALDRVVVTGAIHKLKTWPEYFNEVLSGRKPFEWRVDDRDFKLGDTLLLQEYIPHPENPGREGKYTGREITKTVSYIFSPWATNKRTVVMGLATPTSGDEILIRQLREMATEFAIDNKTDCKQHVCWIAVEPAAWLYEMAYYIKPSDENPFRDWKRVVTTDPPPTIPKDGVRNVVPLYAVTGPRAWTPDQFWEYVGGLAGEFEAGQIRDMLAAKGLSITSTEGK